MRSAGWLAVSSSRAVKLFLRSHSLAKPATQQNFISPPNPHPMVQAMVTLILRRSAYSLTWVVTIKQMTRVNK